MSIGPGRPKIAGRADAQRARILDAAKLCFIEEGLHAATMAQIAQRADMSAGLIYRYFENKNAIVLAIIDRELELRRGRIASLRVGIDFAGRIVEEFKSGTSTGTNHALFLEVSAEAARSTEIAAAASASDRLARDEFKAWLVRPARDGGPGFASRDGESFALLVQLVVDGLAVRSAREPDLDAARIKRALAPLLDKLA